MFAELGDTVFGEFIWDTTKAAGNLANHGVSFEEAASVILLDPNHIVRGDGNDNGNLIAIGYSRAQRILVVVHCERGDLVRIISARRAGKLESREYHGG